MNCRNKRKTDTQSETLSFRFLSYSIVVMAYLLAEHRIFRDDDYAS